MVSSCPSGSMVESSDIERAERILQIIYHEREVPRQLRQAEVDMPAFNNWLTGRLDVIERNHALQYRRMASPLQQAYNTMLMHFFLVGLVCGRDETKEIV